MATFLSTSSTSLSPITIMPPISATTATTNNRRRLWRLRKTKKLPTVRLGGQKQSGSGSGSAMVRMIKRINMRWMKLKKARVLKKLKEYYLCVLKDLTENDRSFEKSHHHQQLLLMETSFAVPVMGIPINSFR
ncbi:hypothetical protein QVD17_29969 [Tagetes erecta]|uniref:Uncharacterized protein n=1 Tax=Tagetes erecta TaxID=13708 RepID=A0AAD8NML8_TARER|nr:hypothetical protein QVD17_29969 [Tagetes erecta]